MVGYDSRKTESDRIHYETLGNGLTDYAKRGLHRIDSTFGFTDDARSLGNYLKGGMERLYSSKKSPSPSSSNNKDGAIPKPALIAPVGFAGGGLIGAAASEGFHRVVSSIPGGSTIIEYGFPFASTKITTGITSNSTYKLVEQSSENFFKNFGVWSAVGLTIAELALLTYMAYDKRKKRNRT